jgi:putative iron-dependent peroxidase
VIVVQSATPQSGILAAVPRVARHLFFSVGDAAALPNALARLAQQPDDGTLVIGVGPQLLHAIGRQAAIPGLRDFPALRAGEVDIPSTPAALWCWLRGDDQGVVLRLGQALERMLAPALVLAAVVDSFRHGRGPNGHGLDLTGYEDGTENPPAEEAPGVALVEGAGPGLDGGSFAALQQWVHDFAAFEAMSSEARDAVMGRHLADNEEIEDAPASAHVKRTAQESFSPEAFVWRRSMPWAAGREAGLQFLAFGHTLDAFEAQLRRMAGLEDGIVDGLFSMSRPRTGAYVWCPPLREGRLDLRALGIAA